MQDPTIKEKTIDETIRRCKNAMDVSFFLSMVKHVRILVKAE